LLDENDDAWQLWTRSATQWRVSFSGLVGLDYPAVFAVAATMGLVMDGKLLDKMQLLEHLTLNKQASESETGEKDRVKS
jgi:hypothetical protein